MATRRRPERRPVAGNYLLAPLTDVQTTGCRLLSQVHVRLLGTYDFAEEIYGAVKVVGDRNMRRIYAHRQLFVGHVNSFAPTGA